MIFKTVTIILALTAVCSSCNQHSNENIILFRAEKLTGHPGPEQVEKIMRAEPDSAFNRLILGKPRYIQLYYDRDSSEFRYKDGRLLEIIVHKPVAPFSAEGVSSLGLPVKVPTAIDTSAYIKWDNVYDGFDVVTFYKVGIRPDGRKVLYKVYLRFN